MGRWTQNLMSYTLFDNLIWTAMSGQINRWRKNTLHLPPTTLDKIRANQTPFVCASSCLPSLRRKPPADLDLYVADNFSNAVVPRPNDWKDHICISGYWFLDTKKDYDPPVELQVFMDKARADGKPLVYIGFGSIVVPE